MEKRIVIMLAVLMSSVLAWSANVTDDALKQLCRDANNAIQTAVDKSAKQAAFDAETAKWGKKNDVKTISFSQVGMMFEYGGLNLDAYLRRWLEPVLNAKAEKDAAFMFLEWKYMPENDNFSHTPKETAAFVRFLQSKGLQKQIDANPDCAADVLSALATMKDANWHTDGFAEGVLRFVECKLPEAAAMDCEKAFNSIARVDSIDNASREAIRKACVAQYEQLAKSLDNARKQKRCNEAIAYLNGPFACGTLVGNAAPEIHFVRMFKEEGDSVEVKAVKTLSELKGKVVLIDFWGTKCVPCIQSFPEVAELQNHYAGKDVVILGITSLQGYFLDMPNHRTVQCRNNPEKELSCVPPYMKGMGINWTIGVSEEDVMNTDYGVLAIPHVVIIDKKGNVRYNAVNADNEAKIHLIDALLAE